MSIRKRMRSTIKWGGAVVTVLLLIVWVGSAWYRAYAQGMPTIGIGARDGRLSIGWREPWSFTPVETTSDFARFDNGTIHWWFAFEQHSPRTRLWWSYEELWTIEHTCFIPIWFLALLIATPTFFIWRRDRKRPPGTCPKCGYSRTGLPVDRTCPECGSAV